MAYHRRGEVVHLIGGSKKFPEIDLTLLHFLASHDIHDSTNK